MKVITDRIQSQEVKEFVSEEQRLGQVKCLFNISNAVVNNSQNIR